MRTSIKLVVAVVGAVLMLGMKCVFVEAEQQSLRFDPAAMMAAFKAHQISQKQTLSIQTTRTPKNCKRKVKDGDRVSFAYTGRIDKSSPVGVKGKLFDSSSGRGPFICNVGAGEVIQGMDRALKSMCIGMKRVVVIPSSLGYGDNGSPPLIPGGATLNFDIELLHID
jgi:FK506-binding protein 2